MGDRASINPLLWITGGETEKGEKESTNPAHDKLKRTWQRMRRWAVRRLRDEGQAEDALQEAAFRVVRASHSSAIAQPDAYVATAVARSVTNILAEDEPLDFVGSAEDVESLMGLPKKDSAKELEDRIFMEEFLAAMDEQSREICQKWLRRDEWNDIADDVGCSVQQAKDKLRNAIESTKKRLLGPGRPKK